MHEGGSDYFPIFLAGVLFGCIFTICSLVTFQISPKSLESIPMSYTDSVTIVLTAITVILAILAVFIGVLAVWGYSQFEKMTRAASAKHLEKMLTNGPFSKRIDDTIVKHVSGQLEDGELRKILTDRIDALLLNDAAHRDQETGKETEADYKD